MPEEDAPGQLELAPPCWAAGGREGTAVPPLMLLLHPLACAASGAATGLPLRWDVGEGREPRRRNEGEGREGAAVLPLMCATSSCGRE